MMNFAAYLLVLHLQLAGSEAPINFPTRSLHWVAIDTSFGLPPGNTAIKLTDSEIKSMKKLMIAARRSYNKQQRSRNFQIRELSRYQYQCFAYLDAQNNRSVVVQGILGRKVDTKNFTMVLDGGNSVMTIRIDITHKKVTEIRINGFG